MAGYAGDIRLGDTLDVKFTTVNTSGVPTTLSGTPAIAAYVGNSTTEITAGITLTADFDSRTGLNQVRVVASSGNGYATATNVSLVITTGTVGGSSVVGYEVASFSIENRSAVMPTTAGRTLDISAGGEAGVDWANVGSPTTTVNLSGTTISTSQAVASVSGAVGSVTGNVGGNVTGSVGSVTARVTANTDQLAGQTVTAASGVTFPASVASPTNITAGTITTVSGNVTGSVGSLAAQAKTDAEDAVWDATLASHLASGSTGAALNAAGAAGDPWSTALPGAYGAGTAGAIVGTMLDAAVSSRLAPTAAGRTLDVSAGGEAGMDWANIGSPTTSVALSGTTISTSQAVASVSGAVGSVTGNVGGNVGGSVGSVTARVTANTDQLAGQTVTAAAGVTFPSSVASPTNITAGTITTVTNLTNAATAGDFTAAMKASLNAATPTVAIGTGGITTSSFAAGAIDAAAVASDTIAEIWAHPIEGTVTAEESLRLANAANGAIVAGAATTTVTIRDLADTKTRVTATVDADGNRSAVSLDLS